MAELTNIQLLRCSDNGLANALVIDPAAERRTPQRLEHHEAQLPPRRLLVAGHELHEPLGSERWTAGWQSCPAEKAAHPGNLGVADQTQVLRELCRHHHPGGDRLAVQPGTVSSA